MIMICDGCNVREPHEHRCHEDRCTVGGEFVEGTCECPECHPTAESLMRENVELDLELGRERERNRRLENADRLLGELLAVIHGDGGHHRRKHGDDESVKAALDRFYKLREDLDELQYTLDLTRDILGIGKDADLITEMKSIQRKLFDIAATMAGKKNKP